MSASNFSLKDFSEVCSLTSKAGGSNCTDGGGAVSSHPCRAGKCTLAQARDTSQSRLLRITRLAGYLANTPAATQSVFMSQRVQSQTELNPVPGREQESLYTRRTAGKHKTSQEKLREGRAGAYVGRTANAESWESYLLLNGKSPKPFSQQGVQVLERKKTQPNPGEAEFGLPHDGLSPALKAPV